MKRKVSYLDQPASMTDVISVGKHLAAICNMDDKIARDTVWIAVTNKFSIERTKENRDMFDAKWDRTYIS